MIHAQHVPVLLEEVMTVLAPAAGESILDCTLGLGGHAGRFCRAVGESGRFTGLDADADNLALAQAALGGAPCPVRCIHTNFFNLPALALPPVDILFADLGLSSLHVDDPERGFSFRYDGPLDLRFDRSGGRTAADLIEESTEADLKRIFQQYGELYRDAGRIAQGCAGHRMETTTQLRAEAEKIFAWRTPQFLPRIFQALRIAVNDELRALEILLQVGPALLRPGGRMGVISFHSLEDRMVKHAFRALATPEKDAVTGRIARPASWSLLTKHGIKPSAQEIVDNPRSRSAMFRVISRVLES